MDRVLSPKLSGVISVEWPWRLTKAPPTPLTAPDTPRATTPQEVGTPQRNGYGRPPRREAKLLEMFRLEIVSTVIFF